MMSSFVIFEAAKLGILMGKWIKIGKRVLKFLLPSGVSSSRPRLCPHK
jgi:hypothetical protein